MRNSHTIVHCVRSVSCAAALSAAVLGCGGATKAVPPQRSGAATLTAATVPFRIQRLLVAEDASLSMISRDGCLATVRALADPTGDSDELRIVCPRSERLAVWFRDFERVTARMAVDRVTREGEGEGEGDDVALPAAQLLTSSGVLLRVRQRADVERMLTAVRALGAELAAAEMPNPGPASAAGFQMLRVMGPAHVFFGGAPTEGVLDARVSTSGQYLCEFLASTKSGPLRATKSGWIPPAAASRAVDEVLAPFQANAAGTVPRSTFASAFVDGSERRADVASTAAVFERFAPVQDALGDACLPELDPPPRLGL